MSIFQILVLTVIAIKSILHRLKKKNIYIYVCIYSYVVQWQTYTHTLINQNIYTGI